jgi:hypothetical protein
LLDWAPPAAASINRPLPAAEDGLLGAAAPISGIAAPRGRRVSDGERVRGVKKKKKKNKGERRGCAVRTSTSGQRCGCDMRRRGTPRVRVDCRPAADEGVRVIGALVSLCAGVCGACPYYPRTMAYELLLLKSRNAGRVRDSARSERTPRRVLLYGLRGGRMGWVGGVVGT